MTLKTVTMIGAGRVGSSVGYLLRKAGYTVTAVAARSLASAEKAADFIGSGEPTTDVVKAASKADIVFITTPDGVIKGVCDKIAAEGGLKSGSLVVHMFGGQSLDILAGARSSGSYRAVIHPLQSVPSPAQGIKNLPGSYFRTEADPEALEAARDLVKALGGVELAMSKWSPDKDSAALYHAGAIAVSNYFVALVDYGLKFYQALGAERQETLQALLPLIRGTLQNIEALGTTNALTGPIARGDVETIQGHLEAMRKKTPELLGLYKELARHTISVAREKDSITRDTAEELRKLVE
jgi:predicted short-subunit dehydrogenase-like oxidoreductase (DUF2520 family)